MRDEDASDVAVDDTLTGLDVDDLIEREFQVLYDYGYDELTIRQAVKDATSYFWEEKLDDLEYLTTFLLKTVPSEGYKLSLMTFDTRGQKVEGDNEGNSCTLSNTKDYFVQFCPGKLSNEKLVLRVVDKN